jgi:hypothetical protein
MTRLNHSSRCRFLFIVILLFVSVCSGNAKDRTAWMKEARWGIMNHYLADWISRVENMEMSVEQWNNLIDKFNVEALAKQIESVGAGYYLITIGQNSGYYLSPNATYDSYVGIQPSKCSRRDLVGDLSEVLHQRGIKLMMYLPSGAPNGDSLAKKALEWQNGPHPNREFQLKWEQVIREWSERWATRVEGWWFDGCYWPNIMYRSCEPPNFASFATAARAGNSESIVSFNPGVVYRTISITPYEDYIAGEIDKPELISIKRAYDGEVDGKQIHVLSFLGEKWGMGSPRFSVQQIVNWSRMVWDNGGVITWDVPIQSNGIIAQPFIDQLIAIGRASGER